MPSSRDKHDQSYTWRNSLLSATNNDAPNLNTFYYLHDHLGSPIRLTNNDSYEAMAYDEFGVPEIAYASDKEINVGGHINFHNPFGYTGYQTEDTAGLYYAQARYYTPTLGRFTAQDIVRDGFNYYLYCSANPLGLLIKMVFGMIGVTIILPDQQVITSTFAKKL